MALIEQEGTFRGLVVDHGVSLSKNDFPQLVLSLEATEVYDEDLGEWGDWSDVTENQITAYLVLVDSKNNETLNYKQVQAALGWDGKSFAELNDLDLSQVQIQFRVEPNTYNEKTTLQVTWIDAFDATPGKTVRKLDAKELKSLDARFKGILKGKTTPAKAQATAKAPPQAPAKAPAKVTQTATQATKAKASAPLVPEVHGRCTKDEAWEACVDLKDDKKFTDEQLANTWVVAVAEVTPGKTDKQVTPEEWFLIKEKVLAEVALF